ncbi:MAG: hypothetical protein V4501_06760 [Pseudomonadota bacterium]
MESFLNQDYEYTMETAAEKEHRLRNTIKLYTTAADNCRKANQTLNAIINYRLAFSLIVVNNIQLTVGEQRFFAVQKQRYFELLTFNLELKNSSYIAPETTTYLALQFDDIQQIFSLSNLKLDNNTLQIDDALRLDLIYAWEFMADHFVNLEDYKKAALCYQVIYTQTWQFKEMMEHTALLAKCSRDLAKALYLQANQKHDFDEPIHCFTTAIQLLKEIPIEFKRNADDFYYYEAQKGLPLALAAKCQQLLISEFEDDFTTCQTYLKMAINENAKITVNSPEYTIHQRQFIKSLENFLPKLLLKLNLQVKIKLGKIIIAEYDKIKASWNKKNERKVFQLYGTLIMNYKALLMQQCHNESSFEVLQDAQKYLKCMLLEINHVPRAFKNKTQPLYYSSLNEYAFIKLNSLFKHTAPASDFYIKEILDVISLNDDAGIFLSDPTYSFPGKDRFYLQQREFANLLIALISRITLSYFSIELISAYYMGAIQALARIPVPDQLLDDRVNLVDYRSKLAENVIRVLIPLNYINVMYNDRDIGILTNVENQLLKISPQFFTDANKIALNLVKDELTLREKVRLSPPTTQTPSVVFNPVAQQQPANVFNGRPIELQPLRISYLHAFNYSMPPHSISFSYPAGQPLQSISVYYPIPLQPQSVSFHYPIAPLQNMTPFSGPVVPPQGQRHPFYMPVAKRTTTQEQQQQLPAGYVKK